MEPIAKRLKQSADAALIAKPKRPQDDIAEQIKRLEAELQASASSSDDDDDDDESGGSSDSSPEDNRDNGETAKRRDGREAVVNLSALANERVEGLPEHLLPKASATAANLRDKKKRKNDEAGAQSLLDVVQWPKKVPFACKPCGFIGSNMEDFVAHRQSDQHLANQGNVEGALSCKLCDKHFTSPHQLEEHKAGKWHLQRSQQRKARHIVKVCYDFMRGQCKWGDRCNFEHTETKAMKSRRALDKTKRKVCDIFQRRGKCKYGDNCLFSHIKT